MRVSKRQSALQTLEKLFELFLSMSQSRQQRAAPPARAVDQQPRRAFRERHWQGDVEPSSRKDVHSKVTEHRPRSG
jgi:hypothetical protein